MSQGPESNGPEIFDRRLLRRRRDRAAAGFGAHDFLVREVGERLADRLRDVRRDFSSSLVLGCHDGLLPAILRQAGRLAGLVQCDLSPAMAILAAAQGPPALVADEEALPFAAGAFDLVVSCLALQWVNDLPGCLLQINRLLRPDGLFLAALVGGESLYELREAMTAAELELEGGASPRVAPFADLRDAGGLLQRAGFALPVADRDRITVDYGDPLRLLADLRGMGATNSLIARRPGGLRRATLFRALEIYRERFARPDGRLTATFEILYLTGWAPAASQPRPLRPGSATARLAEALESDERPAGDKAGPH